MIVIQNIDTQKFSLNGIPYFKNFMPHSISGKLRIVNVYDTKFELVPFININEFSIDGIIYGTIPEGIEALLPIIYARYSLGEVIIPNSTPPAFGTFKWTMRGSNHNGDMPIAGDVFEGMISANEFSNSLVWNGIGPHNNTNLANFNIQNSTEIQ